MTLQQLKYAITIYETGQFSKAAEKLFVTQPSLTRAVNELEKELGITIFIRNRQGITVTEEGEEFLASSRLLYAQYDLLLDTFRKKENVRKKFGVSCHHYSFAVKAFMETISRFEDSNFEFAIRETRTYEIIRDVSVLRSEIGIIYINDYNEKFIKKILRENDLAFKKLTVHKPYVFMCSDNPLAKKKFVTSEELEEYPYFIFEQGEGDPYFYAEEVFLLHSYRRSVKTRDKLTMLNLIAEMNGYTLCTGMIYDKLNGKEYVSVPFRTDDNNPISDLQIGYIYKKSRILSDIGKLYLDNVKRYLKEDEKTVDISD